jgi:DNA-binding SARP family transcriptional activator
VLGGFEARLASGAPLTLPAKKAQALLAYLAVRPGQSHHRNKLATLLWGEQSDDGARGNLRHALANLRRALAGASPHSLDIQGQTVVLQAAGVEVDVVTFERLAGEGTPQALQDAAELYRGDLLLGLTLDAALFEDWLVAERERLRELAIETLGRLLAWQSNAADTERAIQTAMRLVALDPLQEAVHRTLMRLHARQGRRGAALKQYQMFVGVLQRELGAEPEAETRRLHQELLRRAGEGVVTIHGRASHRSEPVPRAGAPAPDLPASETPLLGRQVELEQLRQWLDDAIQGQGHVATIVGEAGIGKTRLVSSLAAAAISRGCRVLIGHCHESDSILPFGPWVDACRSGEVSTDEEILAAVHPTRRAELTRLLPEASLPGLPRPSDGALPLFESVAMLIEQVAARHPLLLVLEDLHWADEMTLRLLAFVSRRVRAWKVLLVATAREEELVTAAMASSTLEELSRAPQAVPLALSPLSRSDTALLVRVLIGIGSDTPALASAEERIWAMSEGNPFVAEEAVRALDLGRPTDVAREGGVALSLPSRVRDLVVRRLGRLGTRGQALAALAAAIGGRFDFALIQSASGMEERDAAEAVDEMVRHRVLQVVGSHLDFVHDRIREVAYSRLLPPRRRLLHRDVVAALETGSSGPDRGTGAGPDRGTGAPSVDRLDEQLAQLAHHALRGELWEKAVHYLRQAGVRATARSALQEARASFAQALEALGRLPESRTNVEHAFEIRLELRPVLLQLGDYGQALERLREAEALAERLDDDCRRARVVAFMANIRSRPDERVRPSPAARGRSRSPGVSGT